jgi:pilus assembly protein CpaB
MSKKLIPLIAIAFVVAVISTAVFYSLFAARLNGAPTEHAPQSGVVTAARELPPGIVVAREDLQVTPWAGGQLPAGSFTKVEQVTGKMVLQPVGRGEPMVQSRLASKDGAGVGVPEGMRAVSVHVSDSSGVVGLLRPGYKVDIQVFASRSQKGPKEEMKTLLRGISVLAVNSQPEPSSQGYFSAPVVTLVAQARDAEALALADSYARLRLSLRNPIEPAAQLSAAQPGEPQRRFRVKAIELTDAGFALLATRLDSRIESNEVSVILAPGPENLDEFLRSLPPNEWTSAMPDALRSAPARFEISPGVHVALMSGNRANETRIRAEVARVREGNKETRSVETVVPALSGRPIVIAGPDWDHSQPEGKHRRLVVLLVPESRST